MSFSAPWTTLSRSAGIESIRSFPPDFGIPTRRTRSGMYVPELNSSCSCSRNSSRPALSTASNVTPSIPGAPLFALASLYAACNVSILQTCTYNPQKRHDGSAFALAYILRLRSYRLIGVFVISPLPSMLAKKS